MALRQFQFADPEREDITKENVVMPDVVNAVVEVNRHLLNFEGCRESKQATIAIIAIRRAKEILSLLEWGVEDDRYRINNGRDRGTQGPRVPLQSPPMPHRKRSKGRA